MRGMRGFLIATTMALIVIGVIRGSVVSVVAHVPLHAAIALVSLNVVVALVWIPFTTLAMRLVDGNLTDRTRAAALVALGITSVVIEAWLSGILRFAGGPNPTFLRRLVGRSDTSALFYIAIVGASFSVRGRRRQIASELAATRLQTAIAGAQLHVLTLQLHPHFLFNALNLISQLAYESVDAAQRAVANLRALLVESLRHALDREVSLADELSFLRAYLEIQQARFRDRLRVTITADRSVERAAVPHLVLQPIVENAIVHGIAPRASAGAVDVAAHHRNGRLILSVADDGHGISTVMRNGVGLTNTRLRLEQLFGTDHQLSLAPREPTGTIVTIDIPYREVEPAIATDDPMLDEARMSESAEPPTPRRLPRWLPIIAGWAAIAMIWTEIGSLPTPDKAPDFDYAATLVAYSINVALWVVLTPLVVRIGKRFDLGMRPTVRVALSHVAFCVLIAASHTAAWLVLLYAIGSPVFEVNLRSMFGWAIWDMAAYIAIVAVSTVVAFSARFRDSRLTMARAQARLTSAHLASLRLRLQPRVLLAALDSLARVVAADPEASEATIARIGDLLRMLLSRADREFVSVGEELELLDAYLDVVRTPEARPRDPVDLPGITDVIDELVPAMLLPTLAASFHGDIDIVRLDVDDSRLCISVRSGREGVDQSAVNECLDRLRRLYDGAARISTQSDASSRTMVELELPKKADQETVSPEIYDLATA
jgi:LytS/YehU family sensor histidine kinase